MRQRPELLSLGQENVVDYMDDTVRLLHVSNRHCCSAAGFIFDLHFAA